MEEERGVRGMAVCDLDREAGQEMKTPGRVTVFPDCDKDIIELLY